MDPAVRSRRRYDGRVATPKSRRHEPPRDVSFPPLTAFDGDLADGEDYEAVEIAARDLGGASAVGASFLGCRLGRCGIDGIRLDRARLTECHVVEITAASIHAGDSSWRDALLEEARVGALLASGSTWDLVRLRGIKANLVDLRVARLTDVVFEDCTIGELDLGSAELRAVRFERTTIDDLSVEGARLTDVDLVGAQLGVVRGIAGLRGASICPVQLLDLAPLLAAHLWITVREQAPASGRSADPAGGSMRP